MKKTNFTPKWVLSSLLMVLGMLGITPAAKADLNPTLSISGKYIPGGTSVLTIEMTINSTTVEYGSLLTLTLPAGWTGTFTGVGVGSGSCFSGTGVVCQDGTNVLIIGDPTCAPGDLCGPWGNGTYQIEIEVSVPPGVSGDQTIDWLLEGDGWVCFGGCSCGDWTCDMGTLTVQEAICTLDCASIPELTGPGVIEVSTDPGECQAAVTITNPDFVGNCVTFMPVIAEGFDSGTMPAGWAIDDGTGDPVSGYSGQTTDGATEGNGVFFDASSVPGSFAVNPNFDGNIALLNDDFGGFPGNIGLGYIVTPSVDLTALPAPVYLSFDWQSNTWDDIVGQFGEFTVDIWDGTNWVNILTVEEDDLGSVVNMDVTAYANAEFAVRFGYNDEGAWAWGAGIDNFELVVPGPPMVTNDYNGTTDASDTYPVGTTTVTFTVYDLGNNPTTCSIDVIVTDDEPPVITCPADQVIDLDPGACEAVVNYDVTATDNCGATVSQLAGLPSGSAFPRGVTTNTFEASDDAGNTVQCSFTVTVNEFANPTTQLACNDQVQISLDENCQAVIGADDILEGGPYGCYDDYIVMVLDATQAPLPSGNVVDGSFIGSTWTVKVVDPDTGNECWGSFTVEDKLAPTIECEDLVINCNADATPGPTVVPGVVELSSGPMPGDQDYMEVTFDVAAPAGAVVKDVNIYLNITHDWIDDLDVFLQGPDGTIVELFTDVGGSGDDVDVTIDDEGAPFVSPSFPYPTPALQGVFQPEQYPDEALSNFDFRPVNGTWTVILDDDFPYDDNGMFINDIILTIEYGGAGPAVADNCGIASIDYVDSEVEGDCGGPASVITRTWTATDLSGNTKSCVQTITKVRPTLADIEFPADVTVSCDDYAANPSIIDATADGAGVPTIGGIPVEIGDLCDIT
ncbi:MAG: HYR domain-containing protein, partial [Gammaproteobacteria bacterium]